MFYAGIFINIGSIMLGSMVFGSFYMETPNNHVGTLIFAFFYVTFNVLSLYTKIEIKLLKGVYD